MLTAIAFMSINIGSYALSIYRGPFWGLIAYMNIYFNTPNPEINWWAGYLPFTSWSYLTAVVLILSLIIHWDKTSSHKMSVAKWAFAFYLLSLLITKTSAFDQAQADLFQYQLFSYCLIIFIMIKTLADEKQLRWFLVAVISLATYISFNAHFFGKRVNYRLEGTGSADAFGSNEFALLLVSIMPFLFVFFRNGGKIERLLCLGAFPIILNAFILCNSRGAAVALILALVISALVVGDRRIRLGIVAAAMLATPVFIYLVDDAFKDRFVTLLELDEAYGDDEYSNRLSSGRVAIWKYGMQMSADHPFGVGPDGFKDMAHLYMPAEILTYQPGSSYGKRSAHNTYLQVMVEQGKIGLGLWLLMCLSICLTLRKHFKLLSRASNIDPFWRNTVFALTVSFLTSLAGGLVTSRVYYEFFWWQIALVAVVISMAKTELEREPSPDDMEPKGLSKSVA